MNRICLILLVIGLSISASSQRRMIIHKQVGTSEYFYLATVDSLTFDSLMVPVAGGTFQMGDPQSTSGQVPVSVTVGSFNMDKYEVTHEKWTAVRTWGLTHGYTDLPVGRKGYNGTTKHPVTEVNWYDVVKWCNARSEMDGFVPAYYSDAGQTTVYRTDSLDLVNDAVKLTANGYRLPTEAEREFAARGGTLSQGYIYSGSNDINEVAWYLTNSAGNTHSVGGLIANELGIYDMSGNVGEWCWDWYGTYSSEAVTNPQGPTTGTSRVFRGAAYVGVADYCQVAFRANRSPNIRQDNRGFRCAQN